MCIVSFYFRVYSYLSQKEQPGNTPQSFICYIAAWANMVAGAWNRIQIKTLQYTVYQEQVVGEHSPELYKSGVGSRGALSRVIYIRSRQQVSTLQSYNIYQEWEAGEHYPELYFLQSCLGQYGGRCMEQNTNQNITVFIRSMQQGITLQSYINQEQVAGEHSSEFYLLQSCLDQYGGRCMKQNTNQNITVYSISGVGSRGALSRVVFAIELPGPIFWQVHGTEYKLEHKIVFQEQEAGEYSLELYLLSSCLGQYGGRCMEENTNQNI